MTTWLRDTNGNKCSVEYFGTKEAAQKALDSLANCENCTNCSGCSDCSRCSRCSYCSGKKDDKENAVPEIPVIENLHQKIFEAVSQPKALEMSTWHTCNTTHCRGGWVVALAGEAGKKLESFHNTLLAAMLIYDASCPGYKINPCRFFDTNEDALVDMKQLAEKAASR